MANPIRNIAIVDNTGNMRYERLVQIAEAVQTQMNRDVQPQWNVGAIVKAFRSINEVPKDWWTCSIVNDIPEGPNLNGVHWYDANGIPFSKARYQLLSSIQYFENNLTKVISEEIIEKCIDPFGNYLKTAKDPEISNQEAEFLVELGDATQAMEFGYYINDVFVTNFIYPAYFYATKQEGVKYDHLGQFTEPQELGEGGYQIFKRGQDWWQAWKINGIKYFIKQGQSLADTVNENNREKNTMLNWIFGILFSTVALIFIGNWIYKKIFKRKKNGR